MSGLQATVTGSASYARWGSQSPVRSPSSYKNFSKSPRQPDEKMCEVAEENAHTRVAHAKGMIRGDSDNRAIAALDDCYSAILKKAARVVAENEKMRVKCIKRTRNETTKNGAAAVGNTMIFNEDGEFESLGDVIMKNSRPKLINEMVNRLKVTVKLIPLDVLIGFTRGETTKGVIYATIFTTLKSLGDFLTEEEDIFNLNHENSVSQSYD